MTTPGLSTRPHDGQAGRGSPVSACSKGTSVPHPRQLHVRSDPCTSTTFREPARACKPSTF